MGKESREIRHTFHSANPFPFLVTCNISYRRLASSKFQNTIDEIRVAILQAFSESTTISYHINVVELLKKSTSNP
jgi:hypothetical protein